jgi:hypothetical protein
MRALCSNPLRNFSEHDGISIHAGVVIDLDL